MLGYVVGGNVVWLFLLFDVRVIRCVFVVFDFVKWFCCVGVEVVVSVFVGLVECLCESCGFCYKNDILYVFLCLCLNV